MLGERGGMLTEQSVPPAIRDQILAPEAMGASAQRACIMTDRFNFSITNGATGEIEARYATFEEAAYWAGDVASNAKPGTSLQVRRLASGTLLADFVKHPAGGGFPSYVTIAATDAGLPFLRAAGMAD